MSKRVAMITVHECPLASSEGKERGGINVYVYELSKALSRLGWHVDAFTRIQDDVNPRIVQVNERFRVIHLPNGPHTPLAKKEILENIGEFTQNLKAYIRNEQVTYDLLHAHYYLSGIVALDYIKLSQKKIPIAMTFHTLGLMKQIVMRESDSDDPPHRIDLEQSLMMSVDRILTSSNTGREYLEALYDAPEAKIAVIPPGVDTQLFRPINQHEAKKYIHTSENTRMVLSVGRIDPVKGFDVLLVALKMLLKNNPELRDRLCLCIIGGEVGQPRSRWSGELKKLEKLRRLLHLTTTVQFVPPLPQEKLPYYYNAADVLVMPSHYESFGMVALEAIACGTPVVATDVTGISPILKEFPQGHIVSANNPSAVAKELAHILRVPHPKALLASSIAPFDWSAIAGRIASEYEKVSL